MFYVCKKREDGTYGVMDTDDGVVEYYSPKELIRIASRFKVEILGMTKKENNQWGIRVLQPTQFQGVSDDILNESTGVVTPIEIDEGISLDSDFYRLRYEELSPRELTEVYGKELSLKLAHVIQQLTGLCYHGETLDMIDGIDCVGYDNVSLGSNYRMSIYCNPDCTRKGLESNGFGLDLFKDGKQLVEGHFSSSFEDYLDDVQSFKYIDLFRAL